jgi:hypothetical protein
MDLAIAANQEHRPAKKILRGDEPIGIVHCIPFGDQNAIGPKHFIFDGTMNDKFAFAVEENDFTGRYVADTGAVDDQNVARANPRDHALAGDSHMHDAPRLEKPGHLACVVGGNVVHFLRRPEGASVQRHTMALIYGFS